MSKKLERLNLEKKAAILLTTVALTGVAGTLSGCDVIEISSDTSHMDVLETKNGEDGKTLNTGVTQRLDVNGEDFKLLVNYQSGEDVWRINSDKKLYVDIRTLNLPDDIEVYIDNIHMDTSIVSTKAGFDGIKQDSMDDRIHNSIDRGFPIDDTHSYFGIVVIEGENQAFMQEYYYGNRNYTTGDNNIQRRYLESDFLERGIWANKIDGVIDLLIVDKATNKVIRQVSVDSSLLVEVNDIVKYASGDIYITYDYDRNGNRTAVERLTLTP